MTRISAIELLDPFPWKKTVNSERCIRFILEPLCEELVYLECFQHHNATAHTANGSMRELHCLFGYRIIRKWLLWPVRFPDLTSCNFYFWGRMKHKVYATNLHTLEELNENTQTIISSARAEELTHVNNAFLWWFELWLYGMGNTLSTLFEELSTECII